MWYNPGLTSGEADPSEALCQLCSKLVPPRPTFSRIWQVWSNCARHGPLSPPNTLTRPRRNTIRRASSVRGPRSGTTGRQSHAQPTSQTCAPKSSDPAPWAGQHPPPLIDEAPSFLGIACAAPLMSCSARAREACACAWHELKNRLSAPTKRACATNPRTPTHNHMLAPYHVPPAALGRRKNESAANYDTPNMPDTARARRRWRQVTQKITLRRTGIGTGAPNFKITRKSLPRARIWTKSHMLAGQTRRLERNRPNSAEIGPSRQLFQL